jgi:hypothetical protein
MSFGATCPLHRKIPPLSNQGEEEEEEEEKEND